MRAREREKTNPVIGISLDTGDDQHRVQLRDALRNTLDVARRGV